MTATQTVDALRRRWLSARGQKSSRPIIRVGVLDTENREGDLANRLLSSKTWCCCQRVEMDADNDYGVLKAFDAMMLVDRPANTSREDEALQGRHDGFLDLFQKRRIGVLIVTSRPWMYAGFNAGVVCLPPDASLEKAQGVLAALAHMRPMIREVDKQLSAMQRLSKNLRKRFDETDRELQLAARLQRDFLPQELPSDGPFRFSSMFRPCSWVSGDIFDVFRLDEKHWGFYLADAVGHGVAAGLLTMYIKHAIRPKRILTDGYELVPPSEVLSNLNDQLTSQGLPDSPFITGWYGTVNIETLVLNYAVAGHPPPILIDVDGRIRELHGDGCLLGISRGERFSDESVHLKPGQRVIVYSDGLEPTLIAHRPQMPKLPTFEEGIPELLRLDADDLLKRLRMRLDNTPGSLMQVDDVTLLMLDVLGNSLKH